MRIAVLFALGALSTACSQSVGGQPEPPTVSAPQATSPTAATTAPQTPAPTGAQTPIPAADASISEVIRWVEDGTAADPTGFHVVFRDGVTTQLGEDIAFTASAGSPFATMRCVTDEALTCLLELDDPPPRPEGAEGAWKPGWITFPGTSVQVGSLRADPGPFGDGSGPELSDGHSLAFGDYRCRADAAGLICVNYAHRTGVRVNSAGVSAYGCLQPAPAPPDAATLFRC
ncbi:hypothetical protein [Mycobacterium sp. SMC-4]|uniref:hypothetical protein n=1 Tax=Mycobacterium sp. SMC-4 TaxID=2857059 RepID=UPI0021B3AF80|nr:hypothetical protein [Mycobacterium sp. SMC-4]UXA16128.1 hypothetical protein KXD98_14850 [Mycobacterium sp. SMC-4]